MYWDYVAERATVFNESVRAQTRTQKGFETSKDSATKP